ncbi:hypothetical protein GGR55DRAFT_462784 [Xylaria sp. FL0064]|nr:hypothetical protein GGR55DRAFT_462784 [Xylaria sp. FL0064]
MVLIEAKRRLASRKSVEEQALDAALKAIDDQNLHAIYAMATWGLGFRFWIVHPRRRQLEPVDDGAEDAGAGAYIDIDTWEGYQFVETMAVIRQNYPLVQTKTLPSQALEYVQLVDEKHTSMQIDTHQAEAGPTHNTSNASRERFNTRRNMEEAACASWQEGGIFL